MAQVHTCIHLSHSLLSPITATQTVSLSDLSHSHFPQCFWSAVIRDVYFEQKVTFCTELFFFINYLFMCLCLPDHALFVCFLKPLYPSLTCFPCDATVRCCDVMFPVHCFIPETCEDVWKRLHSDVETLEQSTGVFLGGKCSISR